MSKDDKLKYFFKPPAQSAKSKEEIDALSKARAENKKVFNRTGYKYILHRLLKNGYFTGLGQTPYESARLAPTEEALSILYLENALE